MERLVLPLNSIDISIIIPTTFSERIEMLQEALISINQQKFNLEVVEVIIVSNYDVNLTYNYKFNIKIMKTSEINLGAKLVLGYKVSRADILVFLEDDDTFSDTKLATVYSAFNEIIDLKFFKNGLQLVNGNGTRLFNKNFMDAEKSLLIYSTREFIREVNLTYIGRYYSVLSSISIRKEIMQSIEKCLHLCNFDSDLSLFLSAIDNHSVLKMEELKLTNYRIHNSGSRVLNDDPKEFVKKSTNYFNDIINTSVNIRKCIKDTDVARLIDVLILRRNLEFDRWVNISICKFFRDLTYYLKSEKIKKWDFRFISINILFFLFRNKMITKYMESFQNNYRGVE